MRTSKNTFIGLSYIISTYQRSNLLICRQFSIKSICIIII
uniref:Uncharacterized protein n=1 Tax=Bacteriophage sp. TaxID=38018 RepID=A0A8D9UHH5_9VIRU|nr:MAG TPA: hypothetical protein [Bacteriophage sp.]